MTIEDDDLLTIEKAWGYALFGYMVGSVPSTRITNELVKSWGVPCKFFFHKHRWILFTFETKDAIECVMEKCLYISFGMSWIIKPIPRLFLFSYACFISVPI